MKSVKEAFESHFGGEPAFIVQAPGRVNLIGEHTDYNDGFVFPVAIDKRIVIAASPRRDRQVFLRALDFNQQSEFSLDSISRDEIAPWSNYPRGVAFFLKQEGYHLSGLEGVIASGVPIGVGLSSSAALELASAWAFLMAARGTNASEASSSLPQLMPAPVDLIRLARKAENEFVGVACGIMDQFISGLGKRHHALFLDCRTLAYQQVPLPDTVKIVVCNTGVKRELASSEYNRRHNECERGVQFFNERLGGISALRDVTMKDFETYSTDMDLLIRRRCRHVISENERVVESVRFLQTEQLENFGQLMNASHESLKEDYEVSSNELDIMVDIARQQPGVLGARMTGAGFGGCTVNLVRNESADSFCKQVSQRYQQATGISTEIYVCNTSDGAGLFLPSEM